MNMLGKKIVEDVQRSWTHRRSGRPASPAPPVWSGWRCVSLHTQNKCLVLCSFTHRLQTRQSWPETMDYRKSWLKVWSRSLRQLRSEQPEHLQEHHHPHLWRRRGKTKRLICEQSPDRWSQHDKKTFSTSEGLVIFSQAQTLTDSYYTELRRFSFKQEVKTLHLLHKHHADSSDNIFIYDDLSSTNVWTKLRAVMVWGPGS